VREVIETNEAQNKEIHINLWRIWIK